MRVASGQTDVQHADVKIALVVVSIAAAVAALSACSPIADTNYHGTVGGTAAPTPISTVSTPLVPAVPVTLTGSVSRSKRPTW